MKIRTGFVSNSSASSFCIYGVCIDSRDELNKNLIELLSKTVAAIAARGKRPHWADDFDKAVASDNQEEISDFLSDHDSILGQLFGLEMNSMDGSPYFVGRSWSSIKDDQTGAQFKAEVREILKAIVGENVAKGAQTYEEAWNDG